MRNYYLIIAFACMGWTVKAQDSLRTYNLDEVVITGTKSEVPVEKSGKTIFKLGQEEIQANAGKSVADLLNEVPGIQMDGNFGPLGTNLSYFVRGASSKRTLILIDGIPFNDPSGINQTYDLRLLDLNQVESIEVLKGGLSTLYGSGAAAGVVNITLKKESESGLSGNAGVEYGSFSTITPRINLSGSSANISYLFNGSYKKSDGFSAAEDVSGTGGYDADGFKGFNLLGKVGYVFSPAFDLTLTVSLDDFDTDFDGGAFFDGDNTSEYQQFRIGLSPKTNWTNGELRADLFYSKLDRLFNSPDFFDPTQRFINEYDAELLQGDVVVNQILSANLKLIGGINVQKQSFSQPVVPEVDFTITDPYVTFIYDNASFNIQVGSRLNNHSEYGSKLVYNVNPSYLLEIGQETSLKLYSSYATSFITPSLFQLYSSFGNLDLEPEESESFEIGSSVYESKVTLNASYFRRDDDQLIDFRSLFDGTGNFIGGEYFNSTSSVMVEGFEVDGQLDVSSKVELAANYSHVKARNNAFLFRVPQDKYGLAVQYRPQDIWTLSVKYNHTGERPQQVFNSASFETETIMTSAYDLVDLFSSYQIGNLTLSGAINNIFDEAYVAVVGFNTIGRNYSIKAVYDF